jgi:hypothetical protein
VIIVPVTALDSTDLALLGNNLLPRSAAAAPRRRRPRFNVGIADLRAVNRSLLAHGEAVGRLHAVPARTPQPLHA